MNRLIITRGLPGCGKTTRARVWVAKDPLHRVRVNRDDFRMMFHGVRYTGMDECERAVTEAQYPTIRALLTAGFDVVSDDTWLNEESFQTVRTLAVNAGSDVEVWDMRDVLPDVCIERDAARGALVGAEAIIGLYRRYIAE